MDDLASSDNASSSATIASGPSCSATATSSRTRSCSSVPRQKMTKHHSFTHVFPATSEPASERTSAPRKDGATSRAALRELLNPTPSTDPENRTQMLFNGLQWLLESSTPGRELDQSSSQPLQALSHDAVNALNSEHMVHNAFPAKGGKATDSGSQSTETWVYGQIRVKREKPW